MQNAQARSGWTIAQYEDTVKSLLLSQKTMVSQDEESQQTIFELKRKLNLKDAMEGEYAAEIAELTTTIENLRRDVKEKQGSLVSLQKSLDVAHQEIEDLKEAEVLKTPPKLDRLVERQTQELLKGPEVSWEEWNNLTDKVQTLGQAVEEAKVKVHALEAANEALNDDVVNWEIKASHLSFACENAKESYADVFSVLEDYKSQLTTAHEELAILSEQPMQPGTRGNSLFSEVEDNRKEIAHRFSDLKNKYLALTVQFRRNAFNPCTYAAERAGLQRLVDEVEAISEQRDVVEIESLRTRIRIQDDIIKQLTAEQHAPIKVVDVVGMAEMRYIEGVVADCKTRERRLEMQLNELSKAHLLMQEELLASQSSLAKANTKLVKELARNRIQFIDRAIAAANEAGPSGSGVGTFQAIPGPVPLDGPGRSTRSPGTRSPAALASVGAASKEPKAGPSHNPPAAAISKPDIQLLVVAPPGPLVDMNYDETRHTPPLCVPAPTIRGSQRHPTFRPTGFAAHGSSKRRASSESAMSYNCKGGASKRRRHLSGPAGLSTHVRHLGKDMDRVEAENGPGKPRAVRFADGPQPGEAAAAGPVPQNGMEPVGETAVQEPMEEGEVPEEMGDEAVNDGPRRGYKRVHIPAVKRQKTGDAQDKKPESADG